MKRAGFLVLLIVVPWVALFGLIELVRGNAVMEVIALELAAVALAIIAASLLVDDLLRSHT